MNFEQIDVPVLLGGPYHDSRAEPSMTFDRPYVEMIQMGPTAFVWDPHKALKYETTFYMRDRIAFKIDEDHAIETRFWTHRELGGNRGEAFYRWLLTQGNIALLDKQIRR